MAAQYRGGLADNQQCRVIILADLDCFYGTFLLPNKHWLYKHAVPAAAVVHFWLLNLQHVKAPVVLL